MFQPVGNDFSVPNDQIFFSGNDFNRKLSICCMLALSAKNSGRYVRTANCNLTLFSAVERGINYFKILLSATMSPVFAMSIPATHLRISAFEDATV